jgi:hypothetical protein
MIYSRPGSIFARPVAEPDPDADRPWAAFRSEPSRPPASDPKTMASRIVEAGKKRRNELVEDTRPPVGSLGRAILDAAARARGEDVK